MEKVSLSREIEMIENYIGLEALRYGDRLKISYEMEGNPEGLKITPLSCIHLSKIVSCMEPERILTVHGLNVSINIK